MNASLLSVLSSLLRSPQDLVEGDPQAVRWPLVLTIVAGAATFGAVVGAYRGGVQILFAAIKMPLLFVVPVVVGLPAVQALGGLDRRLPDWGRLSTAALVGMARAALLAAAFSPVLWLYYSVSPDYHQAVLVLAGALGVVALPGLATVATALPGRRRWLTAVPALLLLAVLTAQTGWLLRPFVARPTAEVSFLRPLESDVADGLGATWNTALGVSEVAPAWDARQGGAIQNRRRR